MSFLKFPLWNTRCVHAYSDNKDVEGVIAIIQSFSTKEGVAAPLRTKILIALEKQRRKCIIAISCRTSMQTEWKCMGWAIAQIWETAPWLRMYTREESTSVHQSFIKKIENAIRGSTGNPSIEFLPGEIRINEFSLLKHKGFTESSASATAAAAVSETPTTVEATSRAQRLTRSVALSGSGVRVVGSNADVGDTTLPWYMQRSLSDEKKVAAKPDSKKSIGATGNWDDARPVVRVGSGGSAAAVATNTAVSTPSGDKLHEYNSAMFDVKILKVSQKFALDLTGADAKPLWITAHPTSSVAPLHLSPYAHVHIAAGETARLMIDLRFDCPRGATLHLELATSEYDALHTRIVHTRMAFGCRTADKQLVALESLFSAPATVVLHAVDTDEVVCTVEVSKGTPVGKGQLFSDSETIPRVPLATADAAFENYVRVVRSELYKLTGTVAHYASGTPYKHNDLPQMIQTCLGRQPLLFYYWNAESTPLGSIAQINLLVESLVVMTCLELGLSAERYRTGMTDRAFADRFIARVMRRLPSLMAYATDVHGESFTVPFGEANPSQASVDCEELSTICALMRRYFLASTCDCARGLRTRLAEYVGLHTIVTTRTGPPETMDAKREGLHSVYWLIPKEQMSVLRSRPGPVDYTLSIPSGDWKSKLAKGGSVMELECLADTEAMRSGTSARSVGPSELLVMGSFLGRLITADESIRYKYQTSIVAAYSVDGQYPAELIPVTRQGKQWAHGISVEHLWSPAQGAESPAIGFWEPHTYPSTECLAAAKEVQLEVRRSNSIYIDPRLSVFNFDFLDANISAAQKVKRVHFTLYNEQEMTLTIKDRAKYEREETKKRAKARGIAGYDALRVQVSEKPLYLMNGMAVWMLFVST